jgi:hypothetical protein
MTRKGYFNAKPPVEAVERLREMYGLEPSPDPKNDNGISVKGRSIGYTYKNIREVKIEDAYRRLP